MSDSVLNTVRQHDLWQNSICHPKYNQDNAIELAKPLLKLRTNSCSHSFIKLEWTLDDSSWVASYRIRRTTLSSNSPSIVTKEPAWFLVSSGSTTWTDNTVYPNALYQYEIFIMDKEGTLYPTGGSIIQCPLSKDISYYERSPSPSVTLQEVTERYAKLQIYSRGANFVELYRSDQEFSYPIAYYQPNYFSENRQLLIDFDVISNHTYSYCAIARNWYGMASSSIEDVDVIIPKRKIFNFRKFRANNTI